MFFTDQRQYSVIPRTTPQKNGSMIRINDQHFGEDSESKVDERTQELFDEFEEHFREVSVIKSGIVDHRDQVFQAWAMQKIAGLQLCIHQIAETYNAHLKDEQV